MGELIKQGSVNTLKVNSDGSTNTFVQDQTSDIVDYYLCQNLNELEIASTVSIDDRVINVVDASLVTAGNYLCIQEGARAFQARILSISVNAITVDTPCDFAFTTAASIAERSPQMNVNGAVTPVSFTIAPVGTVKWDIVRIIFVMTHTSAGSDDKFGNITALTNGVVLRKSNGVHHTIFNAKTNGELRERMYDLDYNAAIGNAKDSTGGRRTFGGQSKNGVVIRLDPANNDALELFIQDDLSGLSSFRMIAQGHVVDD